MASIEGGDGGGGHKKGPGVKKAKKLSTRVDLTPMVDLAFLLVTFFVFTTTMSTQTAMNMNEPNDKDTSQQQKVKESGSMTILLGQDNQIYYYYGQLNADNASEQFKNTDFKNIRNLIVEKKKNTSEDDLMYIIKSDDKSTFKNAINILDEMTISDIPPGHYAEVDISETEQKLIRDTEIANGIGVE